MSTPLLLIAHAPLASALRQAALHVFPEAEGEVAALDVPAHEAVETTLATARALRAQLGGSELLVLADVAGATPCNVACQLAADGGVRVLAGANLPMVLRSLCYRQEALEPLAARAMAGATQCITAFP